jgi:hypothetical protein
MAKKQTLAQKNKEKIEKEAAEAALIPKHDIEIVAEGKVAYFTKPDLYDRALCISAAHSGSNKEIYKAGSSIIGKYFVGGDKSLLEQEYMLVAALQYVNMLSEFVPVYYEEEIEEDVKSKDPKVAYKFVRTDGDKKNVCYIKQIDNLDMIDLIECVSLEDHKEKFKVAEKVFLKSFVPDPKKAIESTNFLLLEDWKIACVLLIFALIQFKEVEVRKKY